MSRLIDADALVADMTNRYCMDCSKRKGMRNGKLKLVYAIGDAPCRACGVGDAIDDIDSAPTIDAVPVKHGKWEKAGVLLEDKNNRYLFEEVDGYKCSQCGQQTLRPFYFCPRCGVKMDEVIE